MRETCSARSDSGPSSGSRLRSIRPRKSGFETSRASASRRDPNRSYCRGSRTEKGSRDLLCEIKFAKRPQPAKALPLRGGSWMESEEPAPATSRPQRAIRLEILVVVEQRIHLVHRLVRPLGQRLVTLPHFDQRIIQIDRRIGEAVHRFAIRPREGARLRFGWR